MGLAPFSLEVLHRVCRGWEVSEWQGREVRKEVPGFVDKSENRTRTPEPKPQTYFASTRFKEVFISRILPRESIL